MSDFALTMLWLLSIIIALTTGYVVGKKDGEKIK